MPRRTEPLQRQLTTVLFTDIVASTDKASQLGDKRWRQVVSAHHTLVRRNLKRFQGREVDTAGDGFFATFDQPGQAIRCAEAVIREVRRLDIEVRAGVHMGEVEVIGPKVGGIAVHIGARIMSKAAPGEVLVSSTIRDLMGGSDMQFKDLGSHELKGVPAQWRLYAVQAPDGVVEEAPPLVPEEPPRRSALRWIGALAAVVLVAGVVIAVVATRGRKGGLSGPAANTAVRVDPSGSRVEGGVPVGRQPRAIAADGNTIWVANFDDGTVQAIDARTNTATPAIALGFSAAPNGIAVGDELVWVISSTSGTLYRIDPNQAHGISPIPVPTGVSGIAFGGNALWLTSNFDDTVLRIDPGNPRGSPEVVQLESGAGPKGVAFGGGAVWVAEGLKGRVARIDPSSMKVTGTVPLLAGNPDQVAFGEGFVWATDPEDDSVTRIDPSANPQGTTISHVGDSPNGVAAGDGSVWVAISGDGTVARIDPKTSNVSHVTIGSSLSVVGVAVTPQAVWVTVGSK